MHPDTIPGMIPESCMNAMKGQKVGPGCRRKNLPCKGNIFLIALLPGTGS